MEILKKESNLDQEISFYSCIWVRIKIIGLYSIRSSFTLKKFLPLVFLFPCEFYLLKRLGSVLINASILVWADCLLLVVLDMFHMFCRVLVLFFSTCDKELLLDSALTPLHTLQSFLILLFNWCVLSAWCKHCLYLVLF